MRPKTVAILGFGEVGRALAEGFNDGVQNADAPRLLIADPAIDGPAGPRMKAAAEKLGAVLHGAPGAWLAEADLVFAAATGKLAVAVAENAAPHLKAGAIYADVNTALPDAMRKARIVIEAKGAAFVDVAIMGAIDSHRHRTPMLVAGGRGAELAESLTLFGFRMQAIDGAAGDASALKLLRSVFTKGLEALAVEALTTASRFGMTERVMSNLTDLTEKGLEETLRMLVTTHCRHAKRRLDEVRSLGGLFAEAGIDPVMSRATEALFKRTVESPVPGWASERETLEMNACLDQLCAINDPSAKA